MSRTMNAFDMKVSTFGGKNSQSTNNIQNFVQDKYKYMNVRNDNKMEGVP